MGSEGQQVQLGQKHRKNGSLRGIFRPGKSGRRERAASTQRQMDNYSVNYYVYTNMVALSLEQRILVVPNTGMLKSATQLFNFPCFLVQELQVGRWKNYSYLLFRQEKHDVLWFCCIQYLNISKATGKPQVRL